MRNDEPVFLDDGYQLRIGDLTLDLSSRAGAAEMIVHVYRTPVGYCNGVFISVHGPGVPEQYPACSPRDIELIATLSLPPSTAAILSRTRAQRLATARAAVDAAARAMVAHISSTEQQTWPTQLSEAQAVQIWRNTPEALPAGTAPLLTVMTAARGYGESVFELADRVIAAAAQYTASAGPLVAWGQRTERALNAAQTLAELNAISLTPPSPAPAPAPEPVVSQQE